MNLSNNNTMKLMELNAIGAAILDAGGDARQTFKDAIRFCQEQIRREGELSSCNAYSSYSSMPISTTARPAGILKTHNDSSDTTTSAEIISARQALAEARMQQEKCQIYSIIESRKHDADVKVHVGLQTENILSSSQNHPSMNIYDRPTLIPDPQDFSSTRSHSDEMSGIVLYNFALSHHLLGLRHADATLLQKAASLYDMSLEIIAPLINQQLDAIYNKNVSFSQDATTKAATLSAAAALNNAGLIYCTFSQYEKATTAFDLLRGLCDVQMKQGQDETEKEIWNKFFITALFMKAAGVAPAA